MHSINKFLKSANNGYNSLNVCVTTCCNKNDQVIRAILYISTSFREGIYVKVTGHLRSFNKQRNMVAFNIGCIENFSHVTHHLVEVVYTHLIATKGAPVVGLP